MTQGPQLCRLQAPVLPWGVVQGPGSSPLHPQEEVFKAQRNIETDGDLKSPHIGIRPPVQASHCSQGSYVVVRQKI